jgi:hypothetical protein
MVTNSALPSYPNLFIFFCPTLPASSEHRLLPTQADSPAHQKETKISQLLTHFSNLYTLAIPNKLCILLHTESLLHQTPHLLACLRPPNNAFVRLQTEVLSPTFFHQIARILPTYLVRSPFSSALSSSSCFQTAMLHKRSTNPNHNLEPPSSPHVHSVRPSQILNQGTIHADVMQGRPSQKR